ncbi:MMPL family transporter [Acidilobus sp.]|uniref:MMPL family transporter n=1 Tax=Acidilobus sp. TaxID=1872109 RepID=UPI003CFF7003
MYSRRTAYVTVVVAIVLAVIFYPFITRINSVVSTNESSMLPQGVESIKVMNIISREGNLSEQGNYIYVVTGVPVNLTTFYRLNGTLTQGTSWVSVARGVYVKLNNVSQRLLNVSLSTADGLVRLWEAVNNLSLRLERLNSTLVGLTYMLRNADYAYAQYYSLGRNLSIAYSQAVPQVVALGNETEGLSGAYVATLFNAIRAEYVLSNMTDAYSTGNLTQGDVELVVSECPPIGGAQSPSPQLVEALFYYVLNTGGPSRFTLASAENFTYTVLYRELNASGEQRALPLLQAYSLAFRNASAAYSSYVESLMNNLTQYNQHRLYYALSSIGSASGREAFLAVISSIPAPGQAKELLTSLAEEYAASGFNESDLTSIVRNVTYSLLSSRLPSDIAVDMASYVANGSFSREAAAELAAKTLAARLPANLSGYAPLVLSYVPEELLEYDPNVTCALCSNLTLAEASASAIAERGLNVTPSLSMALLRGESAYSLSLDLVNRSLTSPTARLLLAELASAGPIEDYQSLLSRMPSLLNSSLARLGVPSNLTPVLSSEATAVLEDPSLYGRAVTNVTEYAFNRTFANLLGDLRGLLVQRNLDGFLVMYSVNMSYDEALSIRGQLASELRSAGYGNASVMLTGTQAIDHDLSSSSFRSISRGDMISALLVLVILAIVLESLVAVLVPFIGIGVGLVVALGVGYLLASHNVITLNSISRTIMYEAGLGLGVDYSSLISKRFREELGKGLSPAEAAWSAARRSWRAVVTGALTASIGFGAMTIASNFPFLRSLGEVAPISILITMAVSLTVVPAVLAIVGGSRILWWPSRVKASAARVSPGRSPRTRYVAFVVVIALILIPAGFIYATFRGSYDFTLMMPQGTQSVQALHYITDNYAAGIMYPVYVVATNYSTLQAINSSISRLSCVQSTQIYNYSEPVLSVTLSVYPLGREAIACAQSIRQLAKQVSPSAMVGGEAAINLDLQNIVYHDFYHLVYPIAIVLMFIVLLAFFGSVPMALTALASVVIAAVFGSSLAIEAYRLSGVNLPWYLPIVVFTAILGVGMDYNSFIINRVREEAGSHDVRTAVEIAVRSTSALVVGLSTIMAGAFAGLLAFSAPGFRGMGVALMAGVLSAGLLAALLFTPAVLYMLGERALWPSRRAGSRH